MSRQWSINRLFKRLLCAPLLLAAALTTLDRPAVAADADAAVPEGFTAIFNGKDLSGWHGQPHLDPRKLGEVSDEQKKAWAEETAQHWTVENGELVNDGKGPYLTTDQSYADCELRLQYKTVAGADSGIYLRGTPQVQIWDSTDESKFRLGADKGSGGLWNNNPGSAGKDPLVKADKPFGEWNSVRIVQVGARTSVWLNDQLVVDHAPMHNYWDRNAPLFATGKIQLQTHGGEIRWKDIVLREIGGEEANAWLAGHGEEGFASIFDGESLSGWTGATDSYEVVDGAIMCKKGHGGTLYTEKNYGDFVVRLEFQVPPQGNNGLAIRYPGKGNPAYDGMTELQVLDNTHPSYARLDPRQFHGSAYGMAAAAKGYLRPVGEWNFQEVTVQGSKIRVELNGTVILDTDLAEITEYMGDHKHPGKELTEGGLGFAGHNDAVRFREIRVKPLAH